MQHNAMFRLPKGSRWTLLAAWAVAGPPRGTDSGSSFVSKGSQMPFACPHCQERIGSNPALAGHTVSCPHCNGQLQMPASAQGTASPDKPPVSRPSSPDFTGIDIGRNAVGISNSGHVRKNRKLSSQAILSVVLGVPGLLCFPVGIVGIVVGWIAYTKITNPYSNESGKGLAIGGMALGFIGVVVAVVIVGMSPSETNEDLEPVIDWRSVDTSAQAGKEAWRLICEREERQAHFGTIRLELEATESTFDVERLDGQRYGIQGWYAQYVSAGLKGAMADPNYRSQRELKEFAAIVQQVDEGKWELESFGPPNESETAETSLAQEQPTSQETPRGTDSTRDVIGCWSEKLAGGTNRITIYRSDAGLLVEQAFGDGSTGTSEIIERPSQTGRRYDNVSDTITAGGNSGVGHAPGSSEKGSVT